VEAEHDGPTGLGRRPGAREVFCELQEVEDVRVLGRLERPTRVVWFQRVREVGQGGALALVEAQVDLCP
jgi:hypothetical protein